MRQPPRVCGGGTPEIENFDPETATLTASRQQQKAARAYELPDVSQESYSLVDGKIIDVVAKRRYVEQLLDRGFAVNAWETNCLHVFRGADLWPAPSISSFICEQLLSVG